MLPVLGAVVLSPSGQSGEQSIVAQKLPNAFNHCYGGSCPLGPVDMPKPRVSQFGSVFPLSTAL